MKKKNKKKKKKEILYNPVIKKHWNYNEITHLDPGVSGEENLQKKE